MDLENRVAEAIRAHTDDLRPRTPELTSIRAAAERQARRRTSLGLAAAAAAVAIGWAALVADPGEKRSLPPVDTPQESYGTFIPASRPQAVVVDPEVTSTVVPAEGLVASVSTEDADYEGDGSSISLKVEETEPIRWEATCAGVPEAWFVVVMEPADIINTGRCDAAEMGSVTGYAPRTGETLRGFVTGEDPAAFRDCFVSSGSDECSALERPLSGGSAVMSIATYAWQEGPVAVTMFGFAVPARDNALSRTWTLTRAAAAATGARNLSFTLDASDQERIVQVIFLVRGGAWCQQAECMTRPRLSLDGEVMPDPALDGPFFADGTWAQLEPGKAYDVRIRLMGGDPGSIELGALVYEADG